jgi:hypothetical protein
MIASPSGTKGGSGVDSRSGAGMEDPTSTDAALPFLSLFTRAVLALDSIGLF